MIGDRRRRRASPPVCTGLKPAARQEAMNSLDLAPYPARLRLAGKCPVTVLEYPIMCAKIARWPGVRAAIVSFRATRAV
jgi:hypothetical protein